MKWYVAKMDEETVRDETFTSKKDAMMHVRSCGGMLRLHRIYRVSKDFTELVIGSWENGYLCHRSYFIGTMEGMIRNGFNIPVGEERKEG